MNLNVQYKQIYEEYKCFYSVWLKFKCEISCNVKFQGNMGFFCPFLFVCLCAHEAHLFPHVEFPGDVGVSVIFITGPAVELSLNDLLLNWQLSRDWKHTHARVFDHVLPHACSHTGVKWLKNFLSFCCLLLGIYVTLLYEKVTWRRGGAYVGAGWLRRTRLDCLGNFKSSPFFMLGGLRLSLSLRHKKS